MKTASFFTYKGLGRVSIARFAPRDTPTGYRSYRKLAPGPWFNKVTREEYEQRFAEQLAELNPAEVCADLENLSGGAPPVLLCWERPPFTETNWCHRRLVANWLKDTMGMEVREHIDRAKLEKLVKQHQSETSPDQGPLFTRDAAPALAELREAQLIELLPAEVAAGLGLK